MTTHHNKCPLESERIKKSQEETQEAFMCTWTAAM